MKTCILVAILSICLISPAAFPAIAGDETVSSKQAAPTGTEHERFIRQAFDLAISAGKRGNHTFGALLVYQGKVVLTTENTVYTDDDKTRHAEINLMVKAKRELPPEVLRQSTLYTSTAPCMMCCTAMWYADIKRVVYGVSYEALAKLTGMRDKSIPCDKLYQDTGKTIEWIGPVLEEEGLRVFCCWPHDSFRPLLLKNQGGCKEMGTRCNVAPPDKERRVTPAR